MSQETVNEIVNAIALYGLRVLGALAIVIVGWIVAVWAGRTAKRAFAATDHIDATLGGFLASLIKYGLLALVFVAALSQLGIATTSFIAIFGAAGLAVALAMQGTLSDLAAGIMLMIFRPIRIDQYVEAGGHAGTVKGVTLFTTELATVNNTQVILPNSSVWGKPVLNYSHHVRRRVDLTVGVDYADDVDKAIALITDILEKDVRVHQNPAPFVMLSNLGDSAVEISMRVWTDTGSSWTLKFDLLRLIKAAFDENGITFPYPQRTVHVVNQLNQTT